MITALLIEDELNARASLKKLLHLIEPSIEIVGETGFVKDALELIEQIPDQQLQFGGSMIIAPGGSILAEAGTTESIIHAEIDLSANNEAKVALDTDGHYSRADVFELNVNTDPQLGVIWNKSSED